MRICFADFCYIELSRAKALCTFIDSNKQKTAILDLGLKSLNEGALND
jgi:hypothetical protein